MEFHDAGEPRLTFEASLNGRAALIAAASPPCHECGEPVQRVESSWQRNGDGDWVPGPCWMVCASGHRVLVELF